MREVVIDGAGTRIRTADLMITNQLLYQLSYAGTGVIINTSRRFCATNGIYFTSFRCVLLALEPLSDSALFFFEVVMMDSCSLGLSSSGAT